MVKDYVSRNTNWHCALILIRVQASSEGQIQEHNDLEMTLNEEQQRWQDVDLLRNDAVNSELHIHQPPAL